MTWLPLPIVWDFELRSPRRTVYAVAVNVVDDDDDETRVDLLLVIDRTLNEDNIYPVPSDMGRLV